MKAIQKLLPIALILCCLVIVPTMVQAQPEDNGGDPAPQDTPIDGGLSVLLAAGAAYGVKRMAKKKDDGQPPTSRGTDDSK